VARNLEPMRGYHVFMRALPQILSRRPRAHSLIVGGDGASYGPSAPKGSTWKAKFVAEVADVIDTTRVHFAGSLRYADYLAALRISSAHVYLTYPFVLSWSLIEAMSAGCVVIASDTGPVRDVVDGDNGALISFFDAGALADKVVDALAHPFRYEKMRALARQTAVERFDAKRVCLPRMMALLRDDGAALTGARRVAWR